MDIKLLPESVARVDLERTGESVVFASIWDAGFEKRKTGTPDREEMFDGGTDSMSMICASLEAQGFSITMSGTSKARALRGPVTRVDFVKIIGVWHILKYPAGWTATTKPSSDEIKSEDEISAAIMWCEKNSSWSVRKWDGGARAFRGAPKPVRDASSIRAMRRKAEEELRRGVNVGTNKVFYDFAFDY